MIKISLFEYFLKGLVEWYCEYYKITSDKFNSDSHNDLSKLKVLKLHFFACSTDNAALDIFNNFHALPYGHVESDIYDNIGSMVHFDLSGSSLNIISDLNNILGDSAENNAIIDEIINKLKVLNISLIAADPFELVELSHRWFSWNFTFKEARKRGSFSQTISPNLIKQEVKYYTY